MIDHTYILLSKLFKQETPEVKSLTEKFYQHAKEEMEYKEANEQDQESPTIKPHIDLTLKCGNCGDLSIYRLKEIVVSQIKDSKPLILDEVICINCNEASEFELTPQSFGSLAKEISQYNMLLTKDEDKEALKNSPLKFMNITVKGKEMGLKEGIQAILVAIEKDPTNPENYISLGYLYQNIKKESKAEEYYKKALEFDPCYIEPYYFLAMIAEKNDENDEALEWIKKGSQHTEKAKYRQDFEMEETEFSKIYTDLYNRLSRKTRMKVPLPLMHPGAFSVKAGRNDPCPCGSGKKHKKCCMH